ncbi:hypothetical protein BASA60_001912 [Batrachochytrium salamandrivorans]|nr:hypothetical protein BASA60_001912 [Batrachochytrium salamandrivorans]
MQESTLWLGAKEPSLTHLRLSRIDVQTVPLSSTFPDSPHRQCGSHLFRIRIASACALERAYAADRTWPISSKDQAVNLTESCVSGIGSILPGRRGSTPYSKKKGCMMADPLQLLKLLHPFRKKGTSSVCENFKRSCTKSRPQRSNGKATLGIGCILVLTRLFEATKYLRSTSSWIESNFKCPNPWWNRW